MKVIFIIAIVVAVTVALGAISVYVAMRTDIGSTIASTVASTVASTDPWTFHANSWVANIIPGETMTFSTLEQAKARCLNVSGCTSVQEGADGGFTLRSGGRVQAYTGTDRDVNVYTLL